ncbi:MAG: XdhC family protein, partial [Pseudomonadota bacterium]
MDLDPLTIAQNWLEEGRSVALATVVQTWGSAPRPVGSHLVIDGEGAFEGSVSGGCVEGAVVAEAMEIAAGAPIQPTIAITQARIMLHELKEAIAAGRLVPDGDVLTDGGEAKVTK